MELTFVNDLGQSFVVEIDPNMELENVMVLVEAEAGVYCVVHKLLKYSELLLHFSLVYRSTSSLYPTKDEISAIQRSP